MRIVVYGGSFNPPHVAHAMVASWLVWTKRADKVLLLPVYQHPFDGVHSKTLAAFERRVRWCNLLKEELNIALEVSTIEQSLPPPSYTIDTLDTLSSQSPQHSYQLIIGADVLNDTDKWKNWGAICERYTPIVVGRCGYPCPDGTVTFPEVSSTRIRDGLTNGRDMSHLLTRRIYQDILEDNPWADR